MSVQSEIDRIEAARDDIAEAIREQDVTVPAGTKLAALADLVRQIVGKVRTVCGKGPDSAGNIALTAADVRAATSSHKHSAADITSGALPVTRGGTGATNASTALQNLGGVWSATTTLGFFADGWTAFEPSYDDAFGGVPVRWVNEFEFNASTSQEPKFAQFELQVGTASSGGDMSDFAKIAFFDVDQASRTVTAYATEKPAGQVNVVMTEFF